MSSLRVSLGRMLRLLTFRLDNAGFAEFDRTDLRLGLSLTWIVGAGRWWDDPSADLAQKTGLGSVAYVVLLSLLLFLIALPLRRREWRLVHVLTFVSLTSPPGLLYAIPIERVLSTYGAAQVNLGFLTIVALWRVALLVYYLHTHGDLGLGTTFVVALLPLSAIVTGVSVLNLARGVVEFMGGLRDATADTPSAEVIFGLTAIAYLTILPLLIAYATLVAKAVLRRARERQR